MFPVAWYLEQDCQGVTQLNSAYGFVTIDPFLLFWCLSSWVDATRIKWQCHKLKALCGFWVPWFSPQQNCIWMVHSSSAGVKLGCTLVIENNWQLSMSLWRGCQCHCLSTPRKLGFEIYLKAVHCRTMPFTYLSLGFAGALQPPYVFFLFRRKNRETRKE